MNKRYLKILCIICSMSMLLMSLAACQDTDKNDSAKASAKATNKVTPAASIAASKAPATKAPATTAPTVKPTPAATKRPSTEPSTLSFFGSATVKIKSKSGKVILIDPNHWAGDYSEEADYLLVTHDHTDHQPLGTVKYKPDCKKITWVEALKDGKYIKLDDGDIKIEAVAAGGNPGHDIKSCVGYIVTVDGVTIYHAGDTSMVDEMKKLTKRKLDYALYPIDGIYNMGPEEATKVANLVGAKHNIPIHAANSSGTHKEDQFTPKGKLEMKQGSTISIAEK